MLDTPTLLITDAITDIFQAVLIVLVWRGKTRYRGMQETKIGVIVVALAALFSTLRQTPLATPAILASNGCFFLGAAITYNGTLRLAGNRPLWRWQLPMGAVVSVFFLYYYFIQPSTPIRTELLGFSTGYLCLGVFLSLARRGPNVNSRIRKTLAVILLLHSMMEFGRSIAVPYFDPDIDFISPSPVLSIFYIEVILFTLAYAVILIQMVSERLQSELKESQSRIGAAFEVASDAFAVFDGLGRLLIANKRFEEFFPDAIGKAQPDATIAALFAGNEDSFGLDPVWLENCLSNSADCEGFQNVSRLPNSAWVQVSVRRTGDRGLVFCWNDISAFKKVEQVLADELAHERTLAAAQRNFVSMASHQFRTPLTVIDINAQLLEPNGNMPVPNRELSERTTRIRRTVKRMVALMETMLGAATAEAGNIALSRAPVDLKTLVHEATARALEVAPGRIFEIDIKNLPPSVSCDANLVDQVIGNILSNAIKYSKHNEKIVVTGSTQGDKAVIAVTDFGVGISPEDQSMIFERFFRGRNVKTVAGTGIGLTLARHIVDLHKGAISVKSRLGEGSTFTIELPVA